MYRIVFLDIDGTILNSNEQLEERLIENIIKLQQKGILVALASGRSLVASKIYGEKFRCSIYVTYNGSFVISNNEVLYDVKIPSQLAFNLCSKTKEYNGAYFHFSYKTSRSNRPQPDIEHLLPQATQSNLTDTNRDAHRLALYLDSTKDRESLRAEITDEYVFDEGNRLEVYPVGSKWSGIIPILNRLGISASEVVAIGNGINDIEMLEAAGLGIAMGNSPDYVKKCANLITEDNDHDGVALALEEIFNL
ncbi:Cof subfamily protein (haloacid dehalogenase superfamily) [Peribacillus sp. B2I2]|uniref:HAD family hydrolase n=1 Tax=Peribacillus TaxID=2675229 RepID=UPI0021AA61D9|nr:MULTISPECIES: HAD family hydrolase [Peribacillus]MCT4477276.1 Cof-type HAD-IIB family hydrolase [Peribacillus frigoritolerans]MDM5358399.1 HAD family hydrolase [Peribacillus sp. ACCC06369]